MKFLIIISLFLSSCMIEPDLKLYDIKGIWINAYSNIKVDGFEVSSFYDNNHNGTLIIGSSIESYYYGDNYLTIFYDNDMVIYWRR